MEKFEAILTLALLIGTLYHLTSYNKESKTPYHGIKTIIFLIALIGGQLV